MFSRSRKQSANQKRGPKVGDGGCSNKPSTSKQANERYMESCNIKNTVCIMDSMHIKFLGFGLSGAGQKCL